MAEQLRLVRVEPQPTYIESSGRWNWPLPERALRAGCCTSVCTASREWWEYAPSEAKPHPFAEAVRLRDDVWYWAIPDCKRITDALNGLVGLVDLLLLRRDLTQELKEALAFNHRIVEARATLTELEESGG